ncbi:MAG: hypothetical protein KF680_05925 [Cryobacterium sp.]|nr:hypothetical protein [Cryobacterium sp.]
MASSPRYVAVGAVIAGVSGYAVILVAARLLGPADYVGFSVFWAALYVLIGFLFGIQQEVTRALRDSRARAAPGTPVTTSAPHLPLVVVTVMLGVIAAGIAFATTPFWAPASLGERWLAFAVMLSVASVLAAVQFTITGTLGSLAAWRDFAAVVSVEGVTRVAVFLLAAWLIGGVEAMGWATVIAFAASWLWWLHPGAREQLLRPIGAPLSRTLARFGQAMIAAGASGILINGFPALLAALAADVDAARLGVLILLVTLTRAPLMVPLTAFASVLVAYFVDRRGTVGVLARPLGIVVIATLAATALAALVGPPLLPLVFGEQYASDALTVGALTAASGGLAALTVTGAAALAADRHTAYVVGWLVAISSSVALFAILPLEVEWRVVVALLAGPLLGTIPHLVVLRKQPGRL